MQRKACCNYREDIIRHHKTMTSQKMNRPCSGPQTSGHKCLQQSDRYLGSIESRHHPLTVHTCWARSQSKAHDWKGDNSPNLTISLRSIWILLSLELFDTGGRVHSVRRISVSHYTPEMVGRHPELFLLFYELRRWFSLWTFPCIHMRIRIWPCTEKHCRGDLYSRFCLCYIHIFVQFHYRATVFIIGPHGIPSNLRQHIKLHQTYHITSQQKIRWISHFRIYLGT